MTKGHNKGKNKMTAPSSKGQDRHLKNAKKETDLEGRNADQDQSQGRKGKNSV